MNLIILSGFLGSGKTSVILSLADFLVKNEDSNLANTVIIENEIGEIGIDDKVLRSDGLEVRELFAGCICCQLTSDLVVTLNDIKEKINPKWVILETTGLAYPGKILTSINKYAKGIESITTIIVVDAERFEELTTITPVLVETQISEGDMVLINKVDLVEETELQSIEYHVMQLNPKADVYRVTANTKVEDCIWKRLVKNYE